MPNEPIQLDQIPDPTNEIFQFSSSNPPDNLTVFKTETEIETEFNTQINQAPINQDTSSDSSFDFDTLFDFITNDDLTSGIMSHNYDDSYFMNHI